MGSQVILADREDVRPIIAEEQTKFIFHILHQLGLPPEDLENCQPPDPYIPEDQDSIKIKLEKQNLQETTSINKKIALRKLCQKYQVVIIDDLDGNIKILVEDGKTLVAEWKKSWVSLKTDAKQLDRSKKICAQIHMNWWSLFEEENNE